MQSTRRRFLVLAGSAFAASAAFFSDLLRSLRPAAAQSTWSLRRATYDDLADLRNIFNQQRGAGLFPFTELIEPWSEQKAASVLDTYTGTLVLSLNGTVAGFAAFVDYTVPGAKNAIVPESDPEVQILAVRVDELSGAQRVAAVKRLAVAVSRDLRRQGFRGCEATIHARTGFGDLFADHIEEKNVTERNGVAEARTVRFRIGDLITDLEAEGL